MQKLLTDIGKKSKKAINKRLSTKKKDKVLKDYRLLILKKKILTIKMKTRQPMMGIKKKTIETLKTLIMLKRKVLRIKKKKRP